MSGTRVDGFPERKAGRPVEHPWEDWMDGGVHKLQQGRHFHSKPESFRVLVHRTAFNHGLYAETQVERKSGKTFMYIQFKETK